MHPVFQRVGRLTVLGALALSLGGGIMPSASAATESDRENQIPLGEATEVGDWTVTVNDVDTNPSTSYQDDTEGWVPIVIDMTLAYNGQDTGTPFWNLSMHPTGNLGLLHSIGENSCMSEMNDIFEAQELQPGDETDVNACFMIPEEDLDSSMLVVEELLSMDNTETYFSLGNDDNFDPDYAEAHLPTRKGDVINEATQDAPAALTDIVSLNDVEFQMVDFTDNNEDALSMAKELSEDLDPTAQAVMGSFTMANLSEDEADAFINYEWTFVSKTGTEYNTVDAECPDYEHDLVSASGTYTGGYVEFNVCMLVPQDDIPGGMFHLVSDGGDEAWFSTDN